MVSPIFVFILELFYTALVDASFGPKAILSQMVLTAVPINAGKYLNDLNQDNFGKVVIDDEKKDQIQQVLQHVSSLFAVVEQYDLEKELGVAISEI